MGPTARGTGGADGARPQQPRRLPAERCPGKAVTRGNGSRQPALSITWGDQWRTASRIGASDCDDPSQRSAGRRCDGTPRGGVSGSATGPASCLAPPRPGAPADLACAMPIATRRRAGAHPRRQGIRSRRTPQSLAVHSDHRPAPEKPRHCGEEPKLGRTHRAPNPRLRGMADRGSRATGRRSSSVLHRRPRRKARRDLPMVVRRRGKPQRHLRNDRGHCTPAARIAFFRRLRRPRWMTGIEALEMPAALCYLAATSTANGFALHRRRDPAGG
jgi:hypothetical protein